MNSFNFIEYSCRCAIRKVGVVTRYVIRILCGCGREDSEAPPVPVRSLDVCMVSDNNNLQREYRRSFTSIGSSWIEVLLTFY